MANLKRWLEEEAGGEKIEAVVIGNMAWGDYGAENIPGYHEMPKGVPLGWEEAAHLLDYTFNSGYGAPACQAVYAWTKSKIIAIAQYDGATWAYSIPRHPTGCAPEIAGRS